jgi:hypothetical protein
MHSAAGLLLYASAACFVPVKVALPSNYLQSLVPTYSTGGNQICCCALLLSAV